MPLLVLERFNYGPDGTFGKMYFPDGKVLYTVECPWVGNQLYKSCIPDGLYALQMRDSPVVSRTTNERFVEGWEVADVPTRSYIMVHPGNWPYNFQGCIGVGLDYRPLQGRDGLWHNAVVNSQNAFDLFMEEMESGGTWDIDIRPFIMSYP